MTTDEQLQQIEITIETAKEAVAMAKALDELTRNRNFKKLITEGYFEKESVRAVMLKADPEMQSPEAQADLNKTIDSIGELRQYFVKVNQLGRQAQAAINANEEAREEILAEEQAAA